MLEKICNFSYFRAVVSERSPFSAFVLVNVFLIGFSTFIFFVLGFVLVFAEIYYFV